MGSKEDVAKNFRERFGEDFLRNEIIAFGSGTTVGKVIELMPPWAVEELSKKTIVSTSRDTSYALERKGLTVSSVWKKPDAIVDGADSVFEDLIIKGGGGALLREKIAWRLADVVYVVITKEKRNRYFNVPALCLPDLVPIVQRAFPGARIRSGGKIPPVISDEGFAILDIPRKDLRETYEKLEGYRPVIIEHGIFDPKKLEIRKMEMVTDF